MQFTSTAPLPERAVVSGGLIAKAAGGRAVGRTTGTLQEPPHVRQGAAAARQRQPRPRRRPAPLRTGTGTGTETRPAAPPPRAPCADPARYLPGLALPQVLEVLPVNGLQHLELVLLPQLVALRRLRGELRRQLPPAAGPGHVSGAGGGAQRPWRAPRCRPGCGAGARPGTASPAAAGGGAGAVGAAWSPQERVGLEWTHRDRQCNALLLMGIPKSKQCEEPCPNSGRLGAMAISLGTCSTDQPPSGGRAFPYVQSELPQNLHYRDAQHRQQGTV